MKQILKNIDWESIIDYFGIAIICLLVQYFSDGVLKSSEMAAYTALYMAIKARNK